MKTKMTKSRNGISLNQVESVSKFKTESSNRLQRTKHYCQTDHMIQSNTVHATMYSIIGQALQIKRKR